MDTMYCLIKKQAIKSPNNLAFIGQNYSGVINKIKYKELITLIDGISQELISLNITAIALRAENSIDWAMIDLAALKANIPIIPVPHFFSTQQIRHTLDSSGVDCLLGDWDDLVETLTLVKKDSVISNMPLFMKKDPIFINLLDNTAKITFTSGSTGMPKGVCLSEKNLVDVSVSLLKTIDYVPERHLVILPLSTLLENITGVYIPLLLGSTTYLWHGSNIGLTGSSQLNIEKLKLAIKESQPNTLVLTPGLLKALIALALQDSSLVDPLKFVAVGGARVSELLIEQASALGIPVFEGYGLSESASVVSLNTPKHNKPGTSGLPLPHIQTFIEKDGELFVKGNIALGYIDEPFESNWLATGDIVKQDEDGYLTLLGRKKNIIITAFGRNISPEWIESELSAFLPSLNCIIFGDASDHLGVLIHLPNELSTQDTESDAYKILVQNIQNKIRSLNTQLPDYAKLASFYLVQDLLSQPNLLTSNGRIKRNIIPEILNNLNTNNLPHNQYYILEAI